MKGSSFLAVVYGLNVTVRYQIRWRTYITRILITLTLMCVCVGGGVLTSTVDGLVVVVDGGIL